MLPRPRAVCCADYLLQVKANHEHLHTQLITDLNEAVLLNFHGMKRDYAQTTDGDHGRIETRRLWCTSDVSWVPDKDAWAKLRSVAVMECRREVIGQATSVERRYPGPPRHRGRVAAALGVCDVTCDRTPNRAVNEPTG